MTQKPTLPRVLSPLGLLLLLCLPATVAGASTKIFLGGGQACLPHDPQLARHPDGGFVALWVDGQLHLRRFDRFGAAIGQERILPAAQSFPPPGLTISRDGTVAVTLFREGVWRLQVLNRDLLPIASSVELEGAGANGRALVAAADDDGFVAVWQRPGGLALARFDAQGQPLGPVLETPSPVERPLADLVVQPDGDLWLATAVGQLVTSPPSGRVTVVRVPAGTSDLETREDIVLFLRSAALAAGAGDEVALALGTGLDITLLRLDDTLEPVAPPSGVAERQSPHSEIQSVELTGDEAGNLLAVWSEGPGFLDEPPVVFVQALTPEGRPAGPVTEAGVSTLQGFQPVTLAAAPLEAGEAVVAWAGIELIPLPPIPCEDAPGPYAVRAPLGGTQSLLVGDGRFRVQVQWNVPLQGTAGRGRALPGSDDAGSFWFFDPANVELTVKLLDGRTVNGHFWFFYGALSNVGYRITVTDQLTGLAKTYDNPPGRLGSLADTLAFAAP